MTDASRWRIGGIALFCVSAFLLVSMGGAVIAAPLTVPLLVIVVQHRPTSAFRAVGAFLVGATVAELAWALTYLSVREAQPWVWLLPVVAALAAVGALLRATSANPSALAA